MKLSIIACKHSPLQYKQCMKYFSHEVHQPSLVLA